jgi:acyl-CoA synthetase (AMP-forming)/AMP-acid ligase II
MSAGAPDLSRVGDYVNWHAVHRPNAVAMTLEAVEVSYGELSSSVDALARSLLAAGVRKGDRVATLQTPHPGYLIAFLATASIGAIWVGLNPRYRVGELAHVVADAQPVLLLTRTRIGERGYDAEIRTIQERGARSMRIVVFDGDPPIGGAESMQAFLAAGRHISDDRLAVARSSCAARDPSLLVYTSGSTGAPKGALLHQEGMVASGRAQNAAWPVDPFSIVNYFPINHVGCVVDCTIPCLLAGGTLHFMEQFDPRACLELMARRRVTFWGSVPSAFQLQLELEDFEEFDLRAIQLIAWGGAAMPRPLIERLLAVCPRLCTNYGMSESCGTITIVAPTDDVAALAHSVGRPLPDIEVRLAPASGASGEAGEVQVRSRRNTLGYWRNPQATAAAFTADGFLRTGDLATLAPDGSYRLVGRLTEMYKSGGYNVYPREIESVLERHPALLQVAVISVPDPLWQEVGIAFVTAATPVAAGELECFCREQLAHYKVPKRFFVETELPLLPIGKVDRRALRERAARLM